MRDMCDMHEPRRTCRAGGALKLDVVAYNTVLRVQVACGQLGAALETLVTLNASGLRPTAATYVTLMHAHMARGAAPAVVELWYQLLQARVLPSTPCLRAYSLAALRLGDTGAPPTATPVMSNISRAVSSAAAVQA
jgi:Pentatricopeptide repeat domain